MLPLSFSSPLPSSGQKSELQNYLWCNISEISEEGQENILCDRDIRSFLSSIGKHAFQKAPNSDSFLSGHWGNWKQLKIIHQCSCHKQDPGSTGLNSHLMWLSPWSLWQEKGCTGNSLWLPESWPKTVLATTKNYSWLHQSCCWKDEIALISTTTHSLPFLPPHPAPSSSV